jgi:hypothetical protein
MPRANSKPLETSQGNHCGEPVGESVHVSSTAKVPDAVTLLSYVILWKPGRSPSLRRQISAARTYRDIIKSGKTHLSQIHLNITLAGVSISTRLVACN